MITTNKIRDLEKRYMEEIWQLISSEAFLLDLKKIEEYIKNNYIELDRNYQIKNKLQLAAERLLSFYIHRNIEITKIYPSVISSDIAFFTKDSLINIDAKTVDLDGNRGDDSSIQFSPNQISFKNKILFAKKIKKFNFKGISLKPGLPEIEIKTGLPCLTFFMGITYRDDGEIFKINRLKLSCIPNGRIIKEDFNNDVIKNFKTYRYLKEDAARKIGDKYVPKNLNEKIPKTWLPFKLNNANNSSVRTDSWLDISLENPFDKSELALWRILSKKYHICLGGDTARIKPEQLKNRKDGSGNKWMGARDISIAFKN